MDHLAEEFDRSRRQLASQQGVGPGKRYPRSLQELAVRYWHEASSAGWSVSRVAERLGISYATLVRWSEALPEIEPVEMREVIVADPVPFEGESQAKSLAGIQ